MCGKNSKTEADLEATVVTNSMRDACTNFSGLNLLHMKANVS